MEKKTPFYDKHIAAGGKMVPFAGYLLPVQYAGIIAEHNAVRRRAGLFDVSHMGEFIVEGENALGALNYLLTNDFTDMETGHVRYSPMCYPDGGTVDDLLVYKSGVRQYYVVVNAANKDKDFGWMGEHLPGGATLKDVSGEVAQVALQGPLAEEILLRAAGEACVPARYYTFLEHCEVGGVFCLVSRTGYTGEDGFELYCHAGHADKLWDTLVAAGGEDLALCGLGARDTLRLEAGMPLYGHELSAEITPRECGLSFAVKLDKPEFIGKEALAIARTRKRVGLKLTGKGIARAGAAVFADGKEIGVVTSGTMSPTLGYAVAMATVPADFAGQTVQADVRGRMTGAEVVKLPFYQRA